jgi:hypothetical protein
VTIKDSQIRDRTTCKRRLINVKISTDKRLIQALSLIRTKDLEINDSEELQSLALTAELTGLNSEGILI